MLTPGMEKKWISSPLSKDTVADFFTLGLWEIAGTPIEGAASGTQVKVEVLYDENDRVEAVKAYSGGHKVQEGLSPPVPASPGSSDSEAVSPESPKTETQPAPEQADSE